MHSVEENLPSELRKFTDNLSQNTFIGFVSDGPYLIFYWFYVQSSDQFLLVLIFAYFAGSGKARENFYP